MANLTENIADGVISHSVDLTRLEGDIRRKVLGVLKRLERDLVIEIERAQVTSTARARYRQARLEKLLRATRDTIRKSYTEINAVHRSNLRGLARVEAQFAQASINGQVGFSLATIQLTSEALRSIAKDSIIQGAPSSEWWGRQSAGLRRRFEDAMRTGSLAGDTIPDLVKRVRGTATGRRIKVETAAGDIVSEPEFVGGIMDVSTSEAQALVRTSVQSVANDSRMAFYNANSDVIKGVQAVVTLDLRTSHICISRSKAAWFLDGKPFPGQRYRGKFPGPPPWHWNCRTTLVPVTKSYRQLGVRKGRQVPASTRASMNGQVAEDTSFDAWLRKQSRANQEEVLGVGKRALWASNQISLTELTDQTGRPLSLAQLAAKVARRN